VIDGRELHYFHVEGKGPNPKPLLLVHGWPGSPLEFLDMIDLLTDPVKHGRDLARLIHEPAALGRAGFDVSVAA
jgi:microsomal epoxide hydrolase